MSLKFTDEYKHEHKTKAEKLADQVAAKRDKLHRIEFNVRDHPTAVLLTDEQLERSKRAAKKQGISLHHYYIKKYTNHIEL